MRAELVEELAAEVAALVERDTLTVVELASEGVTVWKIRREPNGTPRCWFWEPEPLPPLGGDDAGIDLERLRKLALPPDDSPVVLVCTSAVGPRASAAYSALAASRPTASAFICADPLRDVLDEVLTYDPLTQFYELVVLRRSSDGRPELAGCQLFPPGVKRGETRQLRVRCEPSEERGIAFAVVAVAGLRFRLVSIRLASLAPGSYDVTAELRRPGLVWFNGLEARFSKQFSSWSALIESLPGQLELPPPAHLVCMVETSGSHDQVAERLRRASQLIALVPAGPYAMHSVSLVSYGPHAVGSAWAEEPVRFRTWSSGSTEALAEIDRLLDRGAAEVGYQRAAQIECALSGVADRLGQRDGRCVLVTVGARPPYPARRDPITEIIPCPGRRDWRAAVQRLRSRQDTAFGAILDDNCDEEIWACLGADAVVRGAEVDVRGVARRLGLLSSGAEHIPFPLIESDGD